MYRELDWDRLDDKGKIKGPIYVPIEKVHTDLNQISSRDVKRYKMIDTQIWYAEPFTCVQVGDYYEANGTYTHSKVEACRQLGYKDLLICYVVPSIKRG